MALVKYGNQTLTIAEVADGCVIISEKDLDVYRNGNNAYLDLKSKMPIGIDPSQLSTLVEKGQRFDKVNTDLQTAVTQSQESQRKLDAMKLPEGFSVDKWNADRNREKVETRTNLMSELTKKAYAKIKEEFKVDVDIDKRFITEPEGFDPAKPEALEQWIKVLDAAHTAQTEFTQKQLGNLNIPVTSIGASQFVPGNQIQPQNGVAPAKIRGDVLTESGMNIGKL
jgi:hypothetical protein